MTKNEYLLNILATNCSDLSDMASGMRVCGVENLDSNNSLVVGFCMKFIHVFTTMEMLNDLFEDSTAKTEADPENVKAEYQERLEKSIRVICDEKA